MDYFTSVVTLGDGKTPGYSISLDRIDLCLMPIFSHQRREKTVPLWSSASSGPGAEYYEFEVLADEGGDSDDERLENASTHPCHVCGVSVCASHWQRHTDSAAHRASQAIAHTSLTRVQQMALGPPFISAGSPLPQPPRTYFCPPCSTAIALSKRSTHESSEPHSSAVLYGKLLESLASLYDKKDNLNSVCENIFRDIAEHETLYAQMRSRLFPEGSYILHQKKKDLEKEENKDEEGYDASTSETSFDPKLPTENPDYTVLAQSGAKLKVSFDNYHGFSTAGSTLLCRVCRVVIEDRDQHTLVTGHRNHVQAAVKDKHCIRQLTDTLSHCILCNDLVGSSDEAHVASHAHVAALQRALLRGDVIAASSPDSCTEHLLADNHVDAVHFNERNYFCQVCQIYILKSALLEHIGIDAHRKGLSSFRVKKIKAKAVVMRSGARYCNYCRLSIDGGKNAARRHEKTKDHMLNEWLAEKDRRLHYHFKDTGYDNQVTCKICFLQVDINTMNEHFDSFNHQTIYKKLLEDNHMTQTGEYDVDCLLCKSKICIIGALDHIQKKGHRNKIQHCSVYDIGPKEFKLMHQENQDCENEKLKEILQSNQIYTYLKDKRYYECRVCHLCLINTKLLEHIISNKHITLNRQASSSQNTREIKPKGKSLFYVDHENIETNSNEVDNPNSRGDVVKTKNKENVANNDGKKEYQSDKAELKLALKTNLIKSHSDTYNWCNACKRLVTKSLNIMYHIASENHKKNLTEQLKDAIKKETTVRLTDSDKPKRNKNKMLNTNTTTTDSITINAKETEEEANTVETTVHPKFTLQKPTKKLHYLFDWTYDTELEVMCLVCKTNLSYNDVKSHLKSKTHKDFYKDMLETNTMFRIRHRCFCECCREIMKVNQEYLHFTSDRHSCNLTNTERLDQSALKELSIRMFDKDVVAEKRNKSHERYARTNFAGEESDDDEEKWLGIDDTVWSSSIVTFDHVGEQQYSDKSITDSNVSYESAETNVSTLGETKDIKVAMEHSKGNVSVDYIILDTQSQELNKPELPANFQNIAHLFEETNIIKELLCKPCHCAVPNRSDTILEHVEGGKHTKKYEALLINNGLEKVIENSSETTQKYICKSCGTDVSKSDLFAHINSDKHMFYLTAQPSTSGCLQQVKIKTETETNKVNEVKTSSLLNITGSKLSNVANNTSNLKVGDKIILNHLEKLVSENNMATKTDPNITSNISKPRIKQSHAIYAEPAKTEGTDKSKSSIKQSDEAQLVAPIGIKSTQSREKTKIQMTELGETLISPAETKGTDVSQPQVKQTIQTQITLAVTKATDKSAVTKQSDETTGNTGNQQLTSALQNYVENGLCLVCKVNVPNTKTSIIEHLKGNKHNEKVKSLNNLPTKIDVLIEPNPNQKVPVSNAHIENTCRNKVEINITASTSSNVPEGNIDIYIKDGHCNLCNMKVSNNISTIKEHVNGKSHTLMLQSLVTNNKTSANTQKSNEIFQNISEPGDSQSNTGKTEADIVCKITIPHIVGGEAKLPVNNVDTYVKNGRCYLCSMNIPNNVFIIKDHVNGKNHMKNLKSLTTDKMSGIYNTNHTVYHNTPAVTIQNNSAKIELDNNIDTYIKKGHCILCNVKVANNISDIKEHVNGYNHKLMLQSLVTNEKTSANTQNTNEVHQNPLPMAGGSQKSTDKTKAVIVSKMTIPHIVGAEDKLPENNIDIYVKSGHCYLCDIKIPNNVSNIKDHVNRISHKVNLKSLDKNKISGNKPAVSKLVDNNSANIETKQVEKNSIPVIIGPEAKLPENNIDTYVKRCYCYLCSTKIPNNISNIKDHVNGKKHKQMLQSLLTNKETLANTQQNHDINQIQPVSGPSQNTIGKTTSKEKKINITNNKISADIKINQNQSVVVRPSQNTSSKIESSEGKEINTPIIEVAEAKLPENNIDTYVKSGNCYLCDLKIPNNILHIKEHVNGKHHKQNLQSNSKTKLNVPEAPTFNLKNEPAISPEAHYVCHIYNEKVPDNANLKEHMEDARHKMHADILIRGKNVDPQTVVKDKPNNITISTDCCSSSISKYSDIETEKNKETGVNSYDIANKNTDSRNSKTVVQVDEKINVVGIKTDIINSNDTITTNDAYMVTDTNSDIETINISDITNDYVASKNTKSNNAVFVKTTNENPCYYTSNSDTNNPEDNILDIFYNCKTEDDNQETDDSDEGFYICRVCDKTISDNETDLKSHLDSFRHKINLKEKHFKEGMLPNTKTFCDICLIDILNNPIATKKHAESDVHKWRFERLLSENKIKIRDDKVCYCEVCDLYFSKFSVTFHVNRAEHVKHFC